MSLGQNGVMVEGTDRVGRWFEGNRSRRRLLLTLLRVGLLGMAAIIYAGNSELDQYLPVLAALGLLTVATALPWSAWLELSVLAVEAVVAPLVLFSQADVPDALLPYLAVAPVAASWFGVRSTFAISAAFMLGAGAGLLVVQPSSEELTTAFLWSAQSIAIGFLIALIRQVSSPEPLLDPRLVAARALLTELDQVSRSLPGNLDLASTSEVLLQEVAAQVPMTRGMVSVGVDPTTLQPLATLGLGTGEWPQRRRFRAVLESSMEGAVPVARGGGFDGDDVVRHLVPLCSEGTPVGLLAFESHERLDERQLRELQHVVAPYVLRLETALLFDELRARATMEERRRIGREIHDGVAQDLASVGYAIDSIVATAGDPMTRESARELRSEVTRLISELRMSIFDLRTGGDHSGSIGAVLSDYVRRSAARSGLTVHLSMAESPQRLPLSVEVELLRIAQEAITNARKHSSAENLWVTCEIAPPDALLQIEDDGNGITKSPGSGFGLEVMDERAARIGATLTVSERRGGGTIVSVMRSGEVSAPAPLPTAHPKERTA